MNALIAALIGTVSAAAVVVGGGQAVTGGSDVKPVDATSIVAYTDQ